MNEEKKMNSMFIITHGTKFILFLDSVKELLIFTEAIKDWFDNDEIMIQTLADKEYNLNWLLEIIENYDNDATSEEIDEFFLIGDWEI